ncbi:MAG: hypothetical protein FWG90_02690 [Oscillospiraceae bacterium]|nr:hypothetical protein [Oscillospiraceae bacterium]
MLLFINGIPVAVFEFKTAIEEDADIYDVWKQIHYYYMKTAILPNGTKKYLNEY